MQNIMEWQWNFVFSGQPWIHRSKVGERKHFYYHFDLEKLFPNHPLISDTI